MRRFLFASAVLLTLAASTSSAGYLNIRVLLEGSGGGAPTAGGPPTGMSAGGPRGGNPGGETGSPDGGGSGGGPPGTSGGAPPGTSAGGLSPRGAGGTSSGGLMPPSGPVGPLDHARSIVVVIPFTKNPDIEKNFYPKIQGDPQKNPKWKPVLSTQFGSTIGSTNLFTDGSTILWHMDAARSPDLTKTLQSQVLEKYVGWQKVRGTDGLLDLVNEALAHGMVAEANKYADELLALTKTAKSPLSPPVKAFATAYASIQEKLTAPPSKASDGQRWRETIDSVNARVMTQRHYSLVYWDANTEEVSRRFNLLDENFRAFYLWHATQGIALDVPDRPLMAVLPQRASDLYPLSRGLDGFPMEADAFYSAEHDLLVLSPERADDAGQTFLRQNQQLIYKDGLSRAKLLVGDGPKIEGNNNKEHVARMMTLALVEKYAEMEAEYAGVSREGCRQLLLASGALPRHVVLPRWLSNGSANFFTRPRGPVYTKKERPRLPQGNTPGSEYTMTVALTTGYGAPNFVMQKHFRDMDAWKHLNPDRGQLLRNVVTDAYFHALSKDGEDVDPLPKEVVAVPVPKGGTPGGAMTGSVGGVGGPPPGMSMGGGMTSAGAGAGGPRGGGSSASGPPTGMAMSGGVSPATPAFQFDDPVQTKRKKYEKLANKSQATSWALYYYLAKNHRDGLNRFLAELSRLPRDLPIDEQTTLTAFAKAFNLSTGATREDGKETFAEFGQKWVKFILELQPVGIDIDLPDPPPATGIPGVPGAPAGPAPSFPGGSSGTG
jgi:hypothetical protein